MVKIRPRGGYRDLRSFQIATVIYDATYWFCERFMEPRSRMSDQMVQAARSGRQNIAEGSRASATSSQTELRLMNVARSSLEELLLDYEDFLRHRHLPQWPPDSPEALAVRQIGRERPNFPDRTDLSDRTDQTNLSDQARYALYAAWLDHENPAIRANALLCLIHQTNYLLDKQIEALESQFIKEGGYSEQLATARLAERNRQKNGAGIPVAPVTSAPQSSQLPHQSDPSGLIPVCPHCGKLMALRTAQKGRNAGKQFWGCTGYPDCKGVVNI
ncbi:MAG TPA: four helix bundle suffix domain-containing protein [Candidatus Sumerlaeota bacterium]|nr:four helix bundle suffix domain-containing protein [Candidatus Sumerlaeota bacterium]HPS01151.1 four helix bundle suffix domain-containing protein [Candidatus Sumerlaeota bacterium]